jgi:hypothetical protein
MCCSIKAEKMKYVYPEENKKLQFQLKLFILTIFAFISLRQFACEGIRQ